MKTIIATVMGLVLSFSSLSASEEVNLKSMSMYELNDMFNSYLVKMNGLKEAYIMCGEGCSESEYDKMKRDLKLKITAVLDAMQRH